MTAPPFDPALTGGAVVSTVHELFGPEAQAPGQSPDESRANQITAPNPPEDDDQREPLSRYRDLMVALYGSDFPLVRAFDAVTSADPTYEQVGMMPPLEALRAHTTTDEWASWTRGRWSHHRAAVEMHLYLVARNRLFRADQQWVSSKGREPWREPSRPPESARVVHNLIAPALDQRIQVIIDQRPGFDIAPTSLSPNEKRKAEGRQQALEYQYDEQQMERQTAEAAYWAGTDGVAFWEVYWDRDAGPWDERMGDAPGQKKPLGDLRTRTRRVEQVRVSANATATEAPYYVVIRDVLSETEAAYLYGPTGIQQRATTGDLAGNGDNDTSGTGADGIMPSWVLTQTIVGEGNRLNNVRTVERFTMYVDRHPDVLPNGLQLVVVGNAVAWGPDELLFGVIPVIAVRDGSTDPSYYPRPLMEQWIAPQMRVNAALSLWVNSIRVNAGGRLAAKPDAISRETFVGSGLSIIEVESPGPVGEAIQPINGFLVGQDVKDLIAFDVKAIEDMSGYNDVSRGQVSGETATAVATANEQLQRIFTPPVNAVARGFEDWAEINLAGMAWGYDIARDVGSVGTDRPDLARALSSEDFAGPASVRVDAERLLPMPKIYRLQTLDNWYDRGLITSQQFMRNVKFGTFKNLNTPDEDQEARAKRLADAIRMGQPIPPPIDPMSPDADQAGGQPLAMRWTDNESIFQDVLERDILLQDDLDPTIIGVAMQRWKAYAAQAQFKSGQMNPATPPPGGADASGPTNPGESSPPAPGANGAAGSLPSTVQAPGIAQPSMQMAQSGLMAP